MNLFTYVDGYATNNPTGVCRVPAQLLREWANELARLKGDFYAQDQEQKRLKKLGLLELHKVLRQQSKGLKRLHRKLRHMEKHYQSLMEVLEDYRGFYENHRR